MLNLCKFILNLLRTTESHPDKIGVVRGLLDIIYIGSILSIVFILITGGIRMDFINFDLISLKHPVILAISAVLIKRIFYKDSRNRFFGFLDNYPLKKLKFYIFIISLFLISVISSRIVMRDLIGGDEPHFLMMASSLFRDGDLNLRNNYDRGDYYEFYPAPIIPHARVFTDQRIYEAHGVGLPALILPGYIFGSTYGATFIISILFSLLVITIFSLSLLVTNNRILSLGLSFLVSFTIPLVFYSFKIYAELPGALIVSYLFLTASLVKNNDISLPKKIIIGLLLAYLPWLHVRYMIFAIIILAYFWYKVGFRKILPIISIISLSIILILIYMKILYGKFSILGQYEKMDIGVQYLFEGFFGNLIDCRFGLFLYSPYYIFICAGLYFLFRKDKKLFFWWFLFTAPFIICVSSFYHWHGGCCPPLRYIVPIAPLFVMPLVCLLGMYKNRIIYITFAALVYLSFITKDILSKNTILMVNYEYMDSKILNYLKSFGLDLYLIFPTLTEHSVKTYFLVFIWTVSLGLLTYVIIRDYRLRSIKC